MAARSLVSLLLLCVVSAFDSPYLRGEERLFSLSLKGNFTTGSQLFPHPNATDPFQRSQYFSIEDFFGTSVEVKYSIPETNLAIGFSADYIRTTTSYTKPLSTTERLPVEDGYRVIPVEVTGYFHIPVSGPTFGVYMGGGGGVYFGRRIYREGNTEAPPVDEGRGYGIHVLGGLSYQFTEWFGLNAEMKFRDLQFEASNKFLSSQIIYNGRIIPVSGPGPARIHTDGIIFQVGTMVRF
jgi:hypothetical protein